MFSKQESAAAAEAADAREKEREREGEWERVRVGRYFSRGPSTITSSSSSSSFELIFRKTLIWCTATQTLLTVAPSEAFSCSFTSNSGRGGAGAKIINKESDQEEKIWLEWCQWDSSCHHRLFLWRRSSRSRSFCLVQFFEVGPKSFFCEKERKREEMWVNLFIEKIYNVAEKKEQDKKVSNRQN